MKPNAQQMAQALRSAEALQANGDPDGLAATLHVLGRRADLLGEVAGHAGRFVRRGLDEQEHQELVLALEEARALRLEPLVAGALLSAEWLREHDDPDHLGRAILYLHRRVTALEVVFIHAKRYVRFGLDEYERAQLVRALDAAEALEIRELGDEPETLGGG